MIDNAFLGLVFRLERIGKPKKDVAALPLQPNAATLSS
jgi:hypothetical protein